MKILAITDTHDSKNSFRELKEKARNVDVILHCGDFTIFGGNLKKWLRKFNHLGKPFILIHGNHEYPSEVEIEAKRLKNIMFIHENSVIIKDKEFFGYGGDGFSLRDKHFVNLSKNFLEKMKNNKQNGIKNIMLFHGPPYGTALDDLGDKSYCGNKDFTNFIKKAPLELAFVGHIHENFNKLDMIRKTKVINPGPEGMIFEI